MPTEYPVIQSGAANELGGSFSIQTANTKFGTGSLLASSKSPNLGYANSNFITNGTYTRIRVQLVNVGTGVTDYKSYATLVYVNTVGWKEYTNNINSLFSSGRLTYFSQTQYVNGQFIIPVGHNTEGNKWLTSTDGLTWTKVANQSGVSGKLYYGNGQYYLTGGFNTLSRASSLGGQWTSAGVPQTAESAIAELTPATRDATHNILVMAIYTAGGAGSTLYQYTQAYNDTWGSIMVSGDVFNRNQINNSQLTVSLIDYARLPTVNGDVLILLDSTGKIYYQVTWAGQPWARSAQTFTGGATSARLRIVGNTAYLFDSAKIRTSTNGNTWTEIANTPHPQLRSYGDIIYDNAGWTAGGYSSTDAVTWTQHEASYYTPNSTPANINYTNAAWWNTWQTFDFWIYITPNTTSTNLIPNLFVVENPIDFSAQLYITRSGAGDNGISMMGLFTGLVIASNTWSHIRFSRKRSDNTQSLYVNGTRVDTQNISYTGGDSGGFIIGSVDNTNAYPAWSLDELLVSNALITDPTVTSFSVPTAAWDTGANLLLHFDTDTQYQTQSTTKNATANLSVTTSISITAQSYKIVDASARLEASTQLTANNARIKNAVSSLVVSTTLTTNASKISNVSAILTAQFSQIATISDIRGVDMFAFANAQLSVAVNRIRTTNIQVSSAYSITASATAVKRATSNPVSTASIIVNARKQVLFTAALSAAFSLKLDQYTRVQLRSTSTMTVTGAKTARTQANLSSSFRLTYVTVDMSISWLIPADTRTWPVPQETNTWVIAQDITTHTIEREDYTWTIEPQEITYTL